MKITMTTNSRIVPHPQIPYLSTDESNPPIQPGPTIEDCNQSYEWALQEIKTYKIPVTEREIPALGGRPQAMGELTCIFCKPDGKSALYRHAWTQNGETYVSYSRITNWQDLKRTSPIEVWQYRLNGAYLYIQHTQPRRAQLMAPRH